MLNNLEFYVIYEKPSDYPEHFAVRAWRVTGSRLQEDMRVTTHDTLEAARESIPRGATRIPRDAGDPRVIVESWA